MGGIRDRKRRQRIQSIITFRGCTRALLDRINGDDEEVIGVGGWGKKKNGTAEDLRVCQEGEKGRPEMRKGIVIYS